VSGAAAVRATARVLPKRKRRWVRIVLVCVAACFGAFWLTCVLAMLAMKWIDPPTTSVQIGRRVEAAFGSQPYTKHYTFVPLARISSSLQHAVIAAEDTQFYHHHGFDWGQIKRVVDQDFEKHRVGRGASTIDQQLVKNLFLTTSRSFIRKGIEFTLVPMMELLLSKNRILELYLNVIEWGPGVYGAEAAAEYWYRVPASQLTREQALHLAAIIPAPLKRRPDQTNEYSAVIEKRMGQMGW
jgi:monofunctional biosynthetic peptidoglycan transglycosylase